MVCPVPLRDMLCLLPPPSALRHLYLASILEGLQPESGPHPDRIHSSLSWSYFLPVKSFPPEGSGEVLESQRVTQYTRFRRLLNHKIHTYTLQDYGSNNHCGGVIPGLTHTPCLPPWSTKLQKSEQGYSTKSFHNCFPCWGFSVMHLWVSHVSAGNPSSTFIGNPNKLPGL